MRDGILVLITAALLGVVVVSPHVGALLYAWFSLMNPHRLAYGFAYALPFASIIAAVTLVSWMVSKERKLPRMDALAWLLVIFTLWLCVTTMSALAPEAAMEKFDRVIKNMIAVFVTITLIDRKERLMQLCWVVGLSLAFFGVKGGFFALATGGSYHVWGPPATMIEDNNSLALALVMIVPLIYFLVGQAESPWLKRGLIVALVLTGMAILGTQSRGGMVAVGAMGMLLWWRSPHKLAFAAVALVFMAIAALLMADVITERLGSIQGYHQDESVQGRFGAWAFALRIAAEHPITGGGFFVFVLNHVELFGQAGYLNAHSIYFEVLAEHGFVGLALFLGLLGLCLVQCQKVRTLCAEREDLAWAHELASMLQVCMVGYAVGGAFLTMAFYDLVYYLLAIAVITNTTVRATLAAEDEQRRAEARNELAKTKRSLRYVSPVRGRPEASPL